MISNAYAMAQSPANANPQGGGAFGMFVPLIVIFAIFYFLIIRPQRKKENEHKKFLAELKKGDEVMTQSGIYGRIAGIEDAIITLDVGNQVKIRVAKGFIAGAVGAPVCGKAA
jgi:preprotein translocase subunit YajC